MKIFTDTKKWSKPIDSLTGRRLVLLVTGGIAAYKAAELARLFVKGGAQVRTIMTASATRFITPLTFEALTGGPVVVDMWTPRQTEVEHIAWADWAEAAIVAPATANFLAKITYGLADDFASAFMLAFPGPKLLAPAMNSNMWHNPATIDNLNTLKSRNFTIISPEAGLLACGTTGDGRLAAVEKIALASARLLGPFDLAKKIIISAGATQEPWDDIRFLSNRSTGQMGLALALASYVRGAEVKLVCGPAVPKLEGAFDIEELRVTDTASMLTVIRKLLPSQDILIMAAAPADFRPAQTVTGKIKKESGPPGALQLAANPDILKSLDKDGKIFVGFAAESENLADRAKEKLKAKNLDLVIGNQAQSAFAAPDNELLIISHNAEIKVSRRPKFAAAWAILDNIAKLV